MSVIASEIKYLRPRTIHEAIGYAVNNLESFKYIAGGTDLFVNKFQGNIESGCLIDLTGIEELKNIEIKNESLYIGSSIILSDLKNYPEIRNNFPTLIEAAQSVASPLVRNSATIGGNILCENRCLYYNQAEWWRDAVGYCLKCNGEICIVTGTGKACYSEFISDTVPLLISLNAKISIRDMDGEKILNLEDVYTGDGVNPVNLSKTAIIKAIILPLNKDFRSVFKKLRQRESIEYTSLTTALSIDSLGNIIIAMSGVDPKPVVVRGKIDSNQETLIKEAIRKSRSIENDMLSRKYRKEMIRVYLQHSFNEILSKK